jgi:hypothetical protein
MKKSLEAPTRSAVRSNFGALRSASSCGVTPSRSAASSTGSPCSSVPVRKNTSSPRWRWWRARMSAAMIEYACPRCGSALT